MANSNVDLGEKNSYNVSGVTIKENQYNNSSISLKTQGSSNKLSSKYLKPELAENAILFVSYVIDKFNNHFIHFSDFTRYFSCHHVSKPGRILRSPKTMK